MRGKASFNRGLVDMCVTNCHCCQSKSPSTERNTILCACRDGLPNGLNGPRPKGPSAQGGPKPEPLCEVAVINFACCQLFLDFVFVNIRGGLNVSYLWLEAVYFVTRPDPWFHN